MGSKSRSDFAKKCRELRVANHLKQREVAAVIETALSTVGNLECSPYKVINRNRAEKLAKYYKLSASERAAFLAAWEACPLSPDGENRKEYWNKRNALRSKAKNHDPNQCALVECLGIILMDRDDASMCECAPDKKCTVCYALERVGAPSPYTPADRDKILAQLLKKHEALLPFRVSRPAPPASDEIFGG